MSKVAIQGNVSGTGVFTLESPATNTDRTLILPDEAGTVLTSAGVPASAMPAGSVIQVSHLTFATQYSTTTQYTYINTESLVVTPKRDNSKFIIQANGHLYHNITSGRGRLGFSVTQNGTTTRLAGVDSVNGDTWTIAYPGAEHHRLTVWNSNAPAGTPITFTLLLGMYEAGTLYLNYAGYGQVTNFVVTEVAV